MAETDTVVAEPVAETSDTEQAPEPQETAQLEVEETGEGDAPETKVYSEEEAHKLRDAAIAEMREQATREAEEQQKTARKSEVEQNYQQITETEAIRQFRSLVAWGAKHGAEGKTPEEAASLLQKVAVDTFLSKAKETIAPYVTYETITAITDGTERLLEKRFPDWTPSKEVQAAFRKGLSSGDGLKAAEAIVEFALAGLRENELPRLRDAESKAAAEAKQKAQEVKGLQKPGQPGPTRVAGTGGPNLSNRQVLDSAHPLSKEYAAAYKAEHGVAPPTP